MLPLLWKANVNGHPRSAFSGAAGRPPGAGTPECLPRAQRERGFIRYSVPHFRNVQKCREISRVDRRLTVALVPVQQVEVLTARLEAMYA